MIAEDETVLSETEPALGIPPAIRADQSLRVVRLGVALDHSQG